MRVMDVVGKTVKTVFQGTTMFIIDFTDGTKLNITYLHSGENGSDFMFYYDFSHTDSTE